jgi:hypothetical protein
MTIIIQAHEIGVTVYKMCYLLVRSFKIHLLYYILYIHYTKKKKKKKNSLEFAHTNFLLTV